MVKIEDNARCGRGGMVDTPDLKSVGLYARGGSSPPARTKIDTFILFLNILDVVGDYYFSPLSTLEREKTLKVYCPSPNE